MNVRTGDTLWNRFDGLLHRETQEHDTTIHITASDIYRITEGGQLDFGGSEYKASTHDPVETRKKNPDDSYGWWFLAEGLYRVEFNEGIRLEEGEIATVQPLERLLQAGASHPGFRVETSRETLVTILSVGTGGVEIKENARLASVRVEG